MKTKTFVTLSAVLLVAITGASLFLVWRSGRLPLVEQKPTTHDFGFMTLQLPAGYTTSESGYSGDLIANGKVQNRAGTIQKGKISVLYSIQYTIHSNTTYPYEYDESTENIAGRSVRIVRQIANPGQMDVHFDCLDCHESSFHLVPEAKALTFDDSKLELTFVARDTTAQEQEEILNIIRTVEFPDEIVL